MIELVKRYYLFFVIFLVPFIMVSTYYIFIASDIYLSEARITVKQAGHAQGTFNISIPFLGNPLIKEDALLLQEYILSYDMLDHLEKTLSISKLYQDKSIDFIKRLPEEFTQEEFFKYYRKNIVKVKYDDYNSILTLEVYAFKPEIAYKINKEILAQCERYINEISHKIAKEQIDFIEKELVSTFQRKQTASNDLINFQNTHRVVDPLQEIQANLSIITNLESQLALQEAKLKEMLTYLNEDSLQVQAVKNQIEALRKQVEKEKSKLVGGQALNKVALEYLNLRFKVEFLTDVYKATLSAFESTRVEASRKIKNLVIVASPNLPEEALYPKRARNIAIAFILLFLAYGIVSIILNIIREHRL
ncbi:MAG: capsule biosynthesis protein [Aquificaceae bacterium]